MRRVSIFGAVIGSEGWNKRLHYLFNRALAIEECLTNVRYMGIVIFDYVLCFIW